jgi:FtsH-binding integral membrane protein
MNAIIRNRFPALAAVALSALIFVGFARTYYLKFLFDAPPLTVAAQLHGLLATLWLVLHYTQARLVAAHRVDIHKKLGIFAACVGGVLAVQALHLGIAGVAAGHAPPGRDPLQFLSVPIGTTTMFASFLAAALVMRRKREWHKRFMFFATLALIVPAVGRLDSFVMEPLGLPRAVLAIVITIAFVAWAWWDDWRKLGRVHPAYVWGGLLLIASVPLRRAIGFMDWWRPVAEWITGTVPIS